METKFDQSKAILDSYIRNLEKEVVNLEKIPDLTEKQKIKIGKNLEFINAYRLMSKHYKMQLDQNLGKLPPQDLPLEQAILGAIILEPVNFKSVSSFLLPSHFYFESHKTIYSAILSLIQEGIKIDMQTVVFQLRKMGKIELVGGAYYIAEITSKVSSSANVIYHSRFLIQLAIKREMILLLGNMIHDCYEDFTDCFELLEKTEKGLKEIERINVKK